MWWLSSPLRRPLSPLSLFGRDANRPDWKPAKLDAKANHGSLANSLLLLRCYCYFAAAATATATSLLLLCRLGSVSWRPFLVDLCLAAGPDFCRCCTWRGLHIVGLTKSILNRLPSFKKCHKSTDLYSHIAAFCFTETWLHSNIPDTAVNLPGYQLFRADRDATATGKTKGRGVCFYVSNEWCSDLTVIAELCSPDLELLAIHCKPFYSPREISSIILACVYVQPQLTQRSSF
ncbi:hypothetical protein N1851_011207 [Merluccius polli]|uniref:Uncharacterized protein n=1 Tax=Merluccius polli TaxID=89951 RepID=A0AA47P4Y1_MERPO|nr:hypothetical protein N1851_011207 [Merluccius polli]